MAVTKDDTTQGAVQPGDYGFTPAGSKPPAGAKPIPNAKPGTGAKPQPMPMTPGQTGHIETLIKNEPGISQYALRSAIIINALGNLAHSGDVMKFPFPDFLKQLHEALTQDSGVMDLMEAALAKRMGANAPWIDQYMQDYIARRAGYVTEDEQGPALPTQVAKAELDQRNPDRVIPQYEDWSPADILREYIFGNSAAGLAGGLASTIKAEDQGQGVPGAPIGAPGFQAPGP